MSYYPENVTVQFGITLVMFLADGVMNINFPFASVLEPL